MEKLLDDYQVKARSTAIYPHLGKNFVYPTLGLVGEAGEIAEKVKKIIRDKGGICDEETRMAIGKELGDVLWYLANLSDELGFTLSEVATMNLQKLFDRKKRDMLKGEGDNR